MCLHENAKSHISQRTTYAIYLTKITIFLQLTNLFAGFHRKVYKKVSNMKCNGLYIYLKKQSFLQTTNADVFSVLSYTHLLCNRHLNKIPQQRSSLCANLY